MLLHQSEIRDPHLLQDRLPPGLLRVTTSLIEDSSQKGKLRLLIMQHALRDTAAFLKSLTDNGFAVDAFLAKPNSIERNNYTLIEEMGIECIMEPEGSKPYDWYEEEGNLDALIATSIKMAKANSQKLIIVDVGGYFARPLANLKSSDKEVVLGVCEVTSFGHWRYQEVAHKLPVPVVSIARSPLKQAEAIYVGETVVQATEDVLRGAGKVLSSKQAGIIGYGMIGSQIAGALRKRGLNTVVLDKTAILSMKAKLEGFQIAHDMRELLGRSDVIFSATGGQTLGQLEIVDQVKPEALLVSGGSRSAEFDMTWLEERCVKTKRSDHLSDYRLEDGKIVTMLNNGKAANFLKSGTPEEVMDIVFAELFRCIEMMAARRFKLAEVNALGIEDHEMIAALWLRAP